MVKVIICNNKDEASKNAALLVSKEIKKKPNLILGLATGNTMIPLYKELVKLYRNKKVDFSKVVTFNLDEYLSLNNKDKYSFRYFMNNNFFSKVNIKKENINFLNGNSKNINKMCKEYENKIRKLSGIDLQILGIGINGHIAFDEPCSSFKSKTRKIKLSENTRLVNSEFFPSINKVPKYAVTMGISTIMKSRKLILLAFGKEKADIIVRAIKGKVSKEIPASILQKHKEAILILDKEAAYKL